MGILEVSGGSVELDIFNVQLYGDSSAKFVLLDGIADIEPHSLADLREVFSLVKGDGGEHFEGIILLYQVEFEVLLPIADRFSESVVHHIFCEKYGG